MKHRWTLQHLALLVALNILSAAPAGANTPVNVDVERGADQAYVVDAAFDVNVPALLAWEVSAAGGGSPKSGTEMLARAAR